MEKELDQKEEQIETLRKQEEDSVVASEENQTQEEMNQAILDDEDDDDVTLKTAIKHQEKQGKRKVMRARSASRVELL
ncbi:hypothetical protein [Laceyella tengchongensis]